MSYYLRTLGEFSLHRDGPDGPTLVSNAKPLVLVAFLATLPERAGRRDHLAELLWPDVEMRRARASLRQALFSLSQALQGPILKADDSRVHLLESRLDCDLWRFDQAIDADEFERAIEIYGGTFLAGFERGLGTELEHWLEAINQRVRTGLSAAYHHVIDDALAEDHLEEAVAYARRYAESNPLDERAQLTLIRTLEAADDHVGALQAYWKYRTLLREALGDEPSEDLERTIQAAARPGAPEATREPGRAMAGIAEEVLDALSGYRGQERRRRRRLMLTSAGLGALAGAAAAIAGLWIFSTTWANRADSAVGTLSDVDAAAWILRRTGDQDHSWRLEVTGSEVGVSPISLMERDRPAPGTTLVATQIAGPNGYDLALRDEASGEIRGISDDPADELPSDWSPDGRQLLYSAGTVLDDGRNYQYLLGIYDVASKRHRDLPIDVPRRRTLPARWSPDGTRIAVVADPEGPEEVYVTRLDGTGLTNISDHPARDTDPAWAPDGTRLAFASWRSGSADIYTVASDGSGLRRRTNAGTDEVNPVWLSESVIAYTAKGPAGGDVHAIDLRTGQRTVLTDFGDVILLLPLRHTGLRRPWLERVTIRPRLRVVSPGQYEELEARVLDAARRPADPPVPIRWSTTEPEIATVDPSGLLRIHRVGTARLIADLSGWRADTVTLISRPLVEREVEPIFTEDWTGGLRSDRWVLLGDPRPYVRLEGGPDGRGFFVNNGDRNYGSGAYTRRAFSAAEGLTVEVWGRMPFTDRLYQDFTVYLFPEPPQQHDPETYSRPLAELSIQGKTASGGLTGLLTTPTHTHRLRHLPPDLHRWHRYTLQIDGDGMFSFLIDGRLQRRVALPDSAPPTRPLYLWLGERSLHAEIAHGPLRIYPGAKYLVTQDEP